MLKFSNKTRKKRYTKKNFKTKKKRIEKQIKKH